MGRLAAIIQHKYKLDGEWLVVNLSRNI
jgi:hypothetical protein